MSTTSQPNRARYLSHLAHRQWIGYLGLLLPFLLYLLAALRPTPPLLRWDLLNSVSAYYYTGAVAVFVGVLFALGLFLVTYRGYSAHWADRAFGIIGGLCAFAVALFPTGTPGGLSEPPWWCPTTRIIHYIAAISLFIVFIVFSLWLFRKSDRPRNNLSPAKRWRNHVYLWCGIIMVGCVLWAGSSIFTKKPIFWPEAIALEAFALSWLVKGYAYRPLLRVFHRTAGP
ncbi:MAG: DUF998 domain-containing protein [Candidatus Latescibacteria bacterium]|nr:DUF998 domain-containing protein [Candidatus Latescibacterota bacterium]